MSGGRGTGTLILSIDLELELDQHEQVSDGRLDAVRTGLIDLARQYGIVATWAVADPLLSAATEFILAAGNDHEIAVLGDQAWIGPGCGRARLRRELARRFTAARKAGIPVSTLALRNTDQIVELDLLLEHGVTALREPIVHRAASCASAPARYGFWQPPPAQQAATYAGWWLPATWLIRRAIKRTIRRGTMLHFHVDAAALAASPEPDLRLAEAMMRYAAARRDAGQLAVRTIGELAGEALAERAGTPTRSILRPAA
jgi:hypothetical protein